MNERGLSRLFTFLLAAAGICSSGLAQNQLIIGNMTGNHDSLETQINGNGIKAMGFTTNFTTRDLTEIILRLRFHTYPVDAVIEASLYSNNGSNNPGNKLVDFETTIATFTPESYSVTLKPDTKPFKTFRLNPLTTYWLVVRARGGSLVFWEASIPMIEPSGQASHFGARWNNGSGGLPTSNSSSLNSYAVHGTLAAYSAAYFQDPSTGQIGVASIWSSHFTNWRTFPQVVGSGWEVLDFGNYGLTIHADALLRNKTSGQLAFWFANGQNFYQFQAIPQIPPSVWVYHGSANRGTSREHPIFQNPQSGVVVMGVIEDEVLTEWKIFPKVPNLAWEILCVGDTNTDGDSDVLFRNKATGQLAVWRTDGNDFTTWHLMPQVPSSAWEVLDILSSDGYQTPGILFQNKVSKELAVWRFNAAGTALSQWLPLKVTPELKFNYKGFGRVESI